MYGIKILAAVAVIVAGCGGAKKLETAGGGAGGAAYETVSVGKTLWMKRNLDIEAADSWCYEDSPDSCAKYGRLYTWEAAVKACAGLGGGWRLASGADWDALIEAAGGKSVAGTKLKSQDIWRTHSVVPAGNDETGFSALPGGYRNSDGVFGYAGVNGTWWCADEHDQRDAFCRYMHYYNEYVNQYGCGKSGAYSVRCVRDADLPKDF